MCKSDTSAPEVISIGVRGTLRNWVRQIFYYPSATIGPLTTTYDEYWSNKRGTRGKLFTWQKARADMILAQLTKDGIDNPTIADIGAGDGAILASLIARYPGTAATAYDSSPKALEFARALGIHTTVLFDLANDAELRAVTPHDYVLLLEVLEHVPNSEDVLQAARARARKGVFFSFPNTGFFTFRLRLLFGKFPAQWSRVPNEHVRFWTVADVEWWLRALGVTHSVVHTYQGVPILNKIFPRLFAAGILVYIPSESVSQAPTQ